MDSHNLEWVLGEGYRKMYLHYYRFEPVPVLRVLLVTHSLVLGLIPTAARLFAVVLGDPTFPPLSLEGHLRIVLAQHFHRLKVDTEKYIFNNYFLKHIILCINIYRYFFLYIITKLQSI